jgi:hypothetical protein
MSERHLGPVGWICYAAAPAADLVQNARPTWVTLVGVLVALGGLVLHGFQAFLHWKEHKAAQSPVSSDQATLDRLAVKRPPRF